MSRSFAGRLFGVVAAIAVIAGVSAAVSAEGTATVGASGWTIVPSPQVTGGELLGVFARRPKDVWAVGTRAVDGVFSPLAEHWNGRKWKVVPAPASSTFNELYAVASVSSSDAWAVGVGSNWSSLIEHWDGSSWEIVPSPITGPQTPLYGVAAFADDDVWAVGQNGSQGALLHFNGSSWNSVAHPEPTGSTLTAFSKIAGTSATDLWAVGESQTSSQQPLAEHFDGSSWKIVPTAVQGSYNYVRGLAVRTSGDAWFVGDWEDAGPDYTEHPLIQHWDGAKWSAVSSQVGEPWGVAALSATDAWLVGDQPGPSDLYTTMIEHGDGASWSVVQPPDTGSGDSELNGITALPTGVVWAVGSYSPNGSDQPLIEMNPAG